MPSYQKKDDEDRPVSSAVKGPERGAHLFAGKNGAPSYDSKLLAEAQVAAQFRFRILVVDDEPLIRETARMILEGEGYEVLTAADGLEGLHSLNKSLPDLVISDLNMPRMTGFEFLAVVRLRFPHIATIAMSGGYSSGEMQPEFWQTHSCKKEITPSRNFPTKSASFWPLLPFARRERRVTSLHCSCQEIVPGT
jgi:CheY-like chemotaxis protein